MKLFEHEAKAIFRSVGIPTPNGILIHSPEEAAGAYSKVDSNQVVLKTQVLVGGRGKAGGVVFASSGDEAMRLSQKLFSMKIKGEAVHSVLMEPKLDIRRELYLGVTYDKSKRSPVVVASSSGGVEIEEVAKTSPSSIVKQWVDSYTGFPAFMGRKLAAQLGLGGTLLQDFGQISSRLYTLFEAFDADLIETNPLAITGDGRLVAADARLNVADDALYRHSDLAKSERDRLASASTLEARAHEMGVQYVELEGDIGIIGNGAGLTMATLDLVNHFGGRPANFLDAGGGSSTESFLKALTILNDNPKVKVIFVNILAGITRCDDVANAIVTAQRTLNTSKKFVIRLAGTNEEEGKMILKQHSFNAYSDMEEAARRAVVLAGGAE